MRLTSFNLSQAWFYTQSDVRLAIRDKDSNYTRSSSHERRWRYPPSHSRLCPKLATTSTCITLPPNSRVTDGQFKSIGRSGVHHVTLPPSKVCESNRGFHWAKNDDPSCHPLSLIWSCWMYCSNFRRDILSKLEIVDKFSYSCKNKEPSLFQLTGLFQVEAKL